MLSISSRLCFTFKSESNYDKHQQVLKKEQCSVSHPTLSSDSLVRAILNLALPNCTRSSVDNDSPGNKVPSCLNKMRNRCFDLRIFQEESCWRALGLYIGYILFCAVEKIRNTLFCHFLVLTIQVKIFFRHCEFSTRNLLGDITHLRTKG